ncbi:MFS transporter [Nocardioides zeae]|uniref:MFS transporter n=1 Tax=Nocardioides imazamoxiresistens TaxID=3231893 RepID=A0ABU3PZ82_9ACTN|nr:MFS transporter [Nocardioides zeae]MDT9594575.1 MFS transporter [Nocardioides zeae]
MSTPMQRRRALTALFFLPGLAIASWVTRTPAIRDELGASTAEMGLVLFGLSAGSMLGILSSGALVRRMGARPVILLGVVAVVASMPTTGLGAEVGSAPLVTAGLFLFGAGMGGGEVAMNVEGAAVEEQSGRPFLHALHGWFSLGTVVGAVAGIAFTARAVPVLPHLLAVGAIGAVLVALGVPRLPHGTGRVRGAAAVPAAETQEAPSPAPGRPRPDRTLVLVGVVVLAMALAEGTANDWLPLVMVDGHDLDPALGSGVYALFAAAMTVGRLAGGPVIVRLGHARVLAASAALGVVGIVAVSVVDHQVVAALAVVLWGLGTSLGFPVAISAAGGSGPDPTRRVALVATAGYVAFLVGPPALGFLGDHEGLRAALLVPAGVLGVAVLAALWLPSARPGRPGADPGAELRGSSTRP